MGDSGTQVRVPLFPLNTVLFPNGKLPLRIFEPRYLAMVSERMKTGNPFGVILIKEGSEAGQPALFHEIGTLASIIDFNQLEDGLLGLTCQGSQRFRVQNHEVQSDNLVVAEIELIDPTDNASTESFLNQFQSISDFLRQTLDKEELQNYRKELNENWNDSSWVSYQLAELLPLSSHSRQTMLEMSTMERLSELRFVLKENKLIE